MYLAAAGVGRLKLCDHDAVEISNLQRQIAHTTEDVGKAKVVSAARTVQQLNPEVRVEPIDHKLSGDELDRHIHDSDVVIDASDNFQTRFLLNDACVKNRTPLVSGAAIRFEGQVTVFHNERDNSPCYRCLYKDTDDFTESCSESGVLAPVVGIIGTVQATESLKVLLSIGQTLLGRLMILDAMNMEWRTIALKKDLNCPICSHQG
jgi:adenylyltransferase/sulfurtransferase